VTRGPHFAKGLHDLLVLGPCCGPGACWSASPPLALLVGGCCFVNRPRTKVVAKPTEPSPKQATCRGPPDFVDRSCQVSIDEAGVGSHSLVWTLFGPNSNNPNNNNDNNPNNNNNNNKSSPQPKRTEALRCRPSRPSASLVTWTLPIGLANDLLDCTEAKRLLSARRVAQGIAHGPVGIIHLGRRHCANRSKWERQGDKELPRAMRSEHVDARGMKSRNRKFEDQVKRISGKQEIRKTGNQETRKL